MSPAPTLSSSQLPPGMVLHDQCDGYVLCTLGNVIMAFWRQAPSVALIDRLEPKLRQCAGEYKNGLGYMAISLTSKAPEDASKVNNRASTIIKEIGTRAAAYLFTEEGITGKLVKLSLNLTFMLSGVNQRGFTSATEASEFIYTELRKANALGPITAAQLSDAISRTLPLLK